RDRIGTSKTPRDPSSSIAPRRPGRDRKSRITSGPSAAKPSARAAGAAATRLWGPPAPAGGGDPRPAARPAADARARSRRGRRGPAAAARRWWGTGHRQPDGPPAPRRPPPPRPPPPPPPPGPYRPRDRLPHREALDERIRLVGRRAGVVGQHALLPEHAPDQAFPWIEGAALHLLPAHAPPGAG